MYLISICSRGFHNILLLNVRILRTSRESKKLPSRQTDNPFYASRRQTLIVNNYCRGRYRRFTRKREFIIVTCIGRITKVGALLATRHSTETNKILPPPLVVVFSNNILNGFYVGLHSRIVYQHITAGRIINIFYK